MSRDKMRCLNLASLWKKQQGWHDGSLDGQEGAARTPEEQLLWSSLRCEEQLRPVQQNLKGSKEDAKQCERMRDKYHVRPGRSWGFLPKSLQQHWLELQCDCHTPEGCDVQDAYQKARASGPLASRAQAMQLRIPFSITGAPLPAPRAAPERPPRAGADAARGAAEGIWDQVRKRSPAFADLAEHGGAAWAAGADGAALPVVAVLIATTSHGFRWRSTAQLPIVRFMLPSIARTVELGSHTPPPPPRPTAPRAPRGAPRPRGLGAV